jgi:hypothetical protein
MVSTTNDTTDPAGLLDLGGSPRLGLLPGTPRRMDLDRARISSYGVPLPGRLARLRLKQWQHFALVLPDYFVGLALVDVGYLYKTWCFVLDRRTNVSYQHERIAPPGLPALLDLSLASGLFDDRCHVRARGYSVFVRNHLAAGEHALQLHIDDAAGKPGVHGDLRCLHDRGAIQALDVTLPSGLPGRGVYTHKVALPLSGELEVGGRRVVATPEESFALLDVHQAHYPRHTWWNWATCVGRADDGRAIALNLTRNINPDDRAINENALWVDGALSNLGPAHFDYKPDDVLAPWRLRTACGAVDLVFAPQGERSEDLRLGLVRSVFHQPYGTFTGTLRRGNDTLQVSEQFGVCEDHDAVW